jgi:hypothetical protein
MDKETKRKESLKQAGYFTVNILLQKLQELKDQGHGENLVGNMDGHVSFCDFDSDDIFDFLNKRVAFYKQQYKKVKEESLYTPMFIYNAFYMNPGCDHPEVLRDFTESPFVLIELQAKLFELENYINMKKANI